MSGGFEWYRQTTKDYKMSNKQIYRDSFNLLCGEKIGAGSSRNVFECKVRDDLVVKVEHAKYMRSFANVLEQQFYDWHRDCDDVSKWLAPCEYLSPDGRIMLQKRAMIVIDEKQLPDKIPQFLTDRKLNNFGFIDGKLVCVDYQFTIQNPQLRLTKAHW